MLIKVTQSLLDIFNIFLLSDNFKKQLHLSLI